MYTMTTKNTVMRAMTLLAGAMGPKEVLRHFQDKFIPESNSLLKKGYSLGAGQDHLCNHAAWMQSPLEADAPAERLADLSGAPQDSPRSSGGGSNSTSLTSASGAQAPEPPRDIAPPAFFQKYEGLVMIRDVSEPGGVSCVRATVPYWPLHNAWFMAETNPYRSRLWPNGFSVLVDEEPIAAPTHTRAGRSVRKPVKYAPA